MRTWRCGLVAWSCLAAASLPAAAREHFLTIGGGYSPTGNQVSLERNTIYFQEMIARRATGGLPHDIFFSDGDQPGRDLQYWDSGYDVPRANQLLAQIYREEAELGYQYRTHKVTGIRGGSSRANLERWFSEVGSKLAADDRLVIYLTGHGGHSKDSQNNHFYCWNHEQVSVRDLVGWLDKVPQQVSVTMVMVQCYSGGFANVIFNEGQVAKGLSGANRCGFFATVHDRPAAGCTPDIAQEDYKEYSSPFWAAIFGQTHRGQPVAPPDYDGDGRVGFAEAHAYSLLTSDTIDISVKTSEALLRAYSKTQIPTAPDLLTADTPCEALLALATPVERAVIEGLSTQLGLADPARATAARQLGEKLQKDRSAVQQAERKSEGRFNQLRESLRRALRENWPEFNNRWDPDACNLLHDRGPELAASIESQRDFSEFSRLRDEISRQEEQQLNLDRRWCKCQRLIRALENVALAANLPALAGPDVQACYRRLLAAEAGGLAPVAGP